jgi:acetylornithine deacetylase/succinyl-diaminopimelate desuccinylase-like protein
MRTSDVTRAYFAAMSKLAPASEAAAMRALGNQPLDQEAAARLSASSPFYNALLRTTCVPTLLQGGHAENALPQTAQATVNCRMLPDDSQEAVQQALVRALADPHIEVAPIRQAVPSPPSPLTPDVFRAIADAARPVYGDAPLVPFMETGATDGLLLRNAGTPVYGVNGIAYDVNDVRAHGKDERIFVRSYYDGIEFAYQLMKRIADGR